MNCPHCTKELPDQVIEIIDIPQAIAGVKEQPVLYKQYKLRRKSDGLYSTGGTHVRWNQTGKVWNTLTALSGHLAQHKGDSYALTRSYSRFVPINSMSDLAYVGTMWNDLEIVLLEVRENVSETQEASEYITAMRERSNKRT